MNNPNREEAQAPETSDDGGIEIVINPGIEMTADELERRMWEMMGETDGNFDFSGE